MNWRTGLLWLVLALLWIGGMLWWRENCYVPEMLGGGGWWCKDPLVDPVGERIKTAVYALGPPLLLVLAGLVVGWVFAGLRRPRRY